MDVVESKSGNPPSFNRAEDEKILDVPRQEAQKTTESTTQEAQGATKSATQEVNSKPQPGIKEGPQALIPWEAEATLQGTFKIKLKGTAPEGIEIIDLVEDLIEPLVVEAIMNMGIDITSPEKDKRDSKGKLIWAKECAPLRATFTDKDGQILILDGINRKGETDPTRMFNLRIIPKLISVIGEAEYHVIGMNKHKEKTK